MPKIRRQITCVCGAYDFPHRLGGGDCSGLSWVASYREIIHDCDYCNCDNDGRCDVVDGSEGIDEAECVINELHSEELKDSIGKLPMSLGNYLDLMQREER